MAFCFRNPNWLLRTFGGSVSGARAQKATWVSQAALESLGPLGPLGPLCPQGYLGGPASWSIPVVVAMSLYCATGCQPEAAIGCLCITFPQSVLQHASCLIRTSQSQRKLARGKDIPHVTSSEVASPCSVPNESGEQRITEGCGHNTPMALHQPGYEHLHAPLPIIPKFKLSDGTFKQQKNLPCKQRLP